MTTVEMLKAARAKIADAEHWTKFANARDVHDECVSPTSQEAVSWCSLGVLVALATISTESRSKDISFLHAHMNPSLVKFNDTHTHAEVLAAWDAAIADAEKAVTA